MIRKAIIVVLTLGAVVAGVLGVGGTVQAYLEQDYADRPDLYWLYRQFDLGPRVHVMINTYFRGSLAIKYSSLPTRGWNTRTDPLFDHFAGFGILVVRRLPTPLWSQPPGTFERAGWIITVPFLLIAALLGLYPLLAFFRGPFRRWRRHRKGWCAKCGYNLTGLPEPRCPECGTGFES